jgi:hypothetical protein
MTIERPVRNAGPSHVARHNTLPLHRGAPSSGKSWARATEWIPSAPTRTSPPTTTRERRTHAPFVAVERHQAESRNDDVGSKALRDGVQQRELKGAAVDRQLRNLVAGVAPARLTPDQLAVPVEIRQLTGGHTQGHQLVQEPEVGQDAHRVREHVDADAERADLVRRLVHPHAVTGGA